MNTQVILRGITQRGRNRINEHGSVWTRLNMVNSGGQQLYESNNTSYLKWGPHPDFEEVNCENA